MKALIIGGAGFVGGYLIDHLQHHCKWSVCVTKLEQETITAPGVAVENLNILKPEAIGSLLARFQPDVIFHLAAQSSVALSWKAPQLTVDVNIKGAVNLLEAVRQSGSNPRILLIGSGEQYGSAQTPNGFLSEEVPPKPQNIYAITKNCQEALGLLYARAYQIDVIAVRAFNHIGPGQAPQFVASDFARQIARIEMGKQKPVMRVGNLAAKRDFTDVRDIVAAYGLLAQKGISGQVYNVGSGSAIPVRQLLDQLLALSTASIQVEPDPERFRPIDIPVIQADLKKITAHTGWKRNYSLRQTLQDTLNDWRKKESEGYEWDF